MTDFDCGRFKSINEINGTSEKKFDEDSFSLELQKFKVNSLDDFYCGATIVNDRQD